MNDFVNTYGCVLAVMIFFGTLFSAIGCIAVLLFATINVLTRIVISLVLANNLILLLVYCYTIYKLIQQEVSK